ncbi:GDSL esterase/lipase At1g33811 [Silene latifolia]|uniref:GDSL esterase/lipase At1g33811 n=1 Tax=Silene latifolia TaxID=37657 RepID=UPI003D7778F8
METKMSQNKTGFYVLIALLMLCYFSMACNTTKAATKMQVTGFYIFGDSLVDNGNNNEILTLARANYQPYGIDYPIGPTGRFCNGKTVVDALGELLGFKEEIPPFSRAKRSSLERGVNFASGASGIREETGNNLGDHYSMDRQISNFESVIEELRRHTRGDPNAIQNYLNKCIIYSGIGSNDYLNNYFMTNYYTTSSQFTPTAYANALLQEYYRQLTRLYQIGARKVIVTTVGRIGCIPYMLARTNGSSPNNCDEEKNEIIGLFNTGLRQLVDVFNSNQFPGAKFVYLNSSLAASDVIANGFEVLDKGCCGVGKNNGQITCLPLQAPCEDRKKYIFWDAFHPTEIVNVVLAKKAFTSKSKLYAYPINVKQLAML